MASDNETGSQAGIRACPYLGQPARPATDVTTRRDANRADASKSLMIPLPSDGVCDVKSGAAMKSTERRARARHVAGIELGRGSGGRGDPCRIGPPERRGSRHRLVICAGGGGLAFFTVKPIFFSSDRPKAPPA